MTPVTLRPVREDDAEALLSIYAPYVKETVISLETVPPTADEFRRRIREITAVYPYLAAVTDGRIVGYAYAHRFHERAAYDWTAETTVYVAHDVRGRGVGKTLYEALLDDLREMNVVRAAALVTTENEASLAFHRALGFAVDGIVPGCAYKLGRWVGVATLSKVLQSPAVPSPLIPYPELTVRRHP